MFVLHVGRVSGNCVSLFLKTLGTKPQISAELLSNSVCFRGIQIFPYFKRFFWDSKLFPVFDRSPGIRMFFRDTNVYGFRRSSLPGEPPSPSPPNASFLECLSVSPHLTPVPSPPHLPPLSPGPVSPAPPHPLPVPSHPVVILAPFSL